MPKNINKKLTPHSVQRIHINFQLILLSIVLLVMLMQVWTLGLFTILKNPGQFGWKIPNGKNRLPFTTNSDHGERVTFLHTEHLRRVVVRTKIVDYLELV